MPLPQVDDKPKEERVKETIRLLKGLKANGLSDGDGPFRAIKDLLTHWVETGEAVDTKIDLFRQNRIAHISLPKGSDRPATIALKVIREVDPDLD
jgi:hypothetical protein